MSDASSVSRSPAVTPFSPNDPYYCRNFWFKTVPFGTWYMFFKCSSKSITPSPVKEKYVHILEFLSQFSCMLTARGDQVESWVKFASRAVCPSVVLSVVVVVETKRNKTKKAP